MTFTAMSVTTWLTLFGSIGGVITLLYMLRLRRRRVEVPFGPLWQQVLSERQTTSLFRVLKRFWSLIVQLLILAAILTAIADPRWTGEMTVDFREPREAEPRHTLLVVDTSASMGAVDVEGGRFVRAQQVAHDIINSRHPSERMMVAQMGVDISAMTQWTDDTDQLRRVVNRLRVQDTGTDPRPVMEFARNAIRGLPNAQVVLVTDRSFEPPDAELAKSLRLKVAPVGTDEANLGNVAVLDFNVRSHLGNTLKYALYYKLKNMTDQSVTVSAFLHVDPKGEARTRSEFLALPPVGAPFEHVLAPGEEKVVEKLDVAMEGSRAALIIAPKSAEFKDVFPNDDAAFAVVPQRDEVKVLLVGPTNLFLEAALQTRTHVSVERVDLDAYPGSTGYDLIVFNGAAPEEPGKGNFVYVNVASNTPYTVKDTVAGGPLLVPSSRAKHPVMRFVKFVELEAENLIGMRRQRKEVVLARTKRGKPAIIAKTARDQRWLAVGFDPIAARWVTHYSFSIFFVNAVNWFFSEESKHLRAWSLAERWDVRVPWSGVERVRVTRPDGSVDDALVDGSGLLAYAGTHEGIYEVRHPDPQSKAHEQVVAVAAALRNAEESKLLSRGDYAAWTRPPLETDELGTPDLLGAEIWQLLVLFAGALMMVEWFTYHRRWTV